MSTNPRSGRAYPIPRSERYRKNGRSVAEERARRIAEKDGEAVAFSMTGTPDIPTSVVPITFSGTLCIQVGASTFGVPSWGHYYFDPISPAICIVELPDGVHLLHEAGEVVLDARRRPEFAAALAHDRAAMKPWPGTAH